MSREALEAVERFLQLLSRRVRVEAAYLFGSHVRGDWLRHSDVDLVLVSSDFEGMPYTRRLDLLNEIQWRAGIRPFIEVIPLTPEEFERKLKESAVLRDASRYWIRLR